MPINPNSANERTKIPALGDIKIDHSKSKYISMLKSLKTTWNKDVQKHPRSLQRSKKTQILRKTIVAILKTKIERSVPIRFRMRLSRVTRKTLRLTGTGKNLKKKKIVKSLRA